MTHAAPTRRVSDRGCTDTNGNGADFTSGTPNPRNSASAPNVCAGGGQPVLKVANVGLAEGNSGNTAFDFVLSLSAPAGEGGVSFDVSPSDGTAPAGNDYVASANNPQSIAAGHDRPTGRG